MCAPMVSSIVVPSSGAEKRARLPPTSSARSRMPERPRPPTRPRGRPLRPALPGPGSKPRAVVGDAQDRAADEGELDADVRGAGVLGDVGEALLRDAVDHELLLVGQRSAGRRGARSARRSRCAARSPRPGRRARGSGRGRRARSGAAGARGAAAPPSPGWRGAWSPGARGAARSGASIVVASSRSRMPVSAWLTSSWRSWAMRERSCSWPRSTARPAWRRSSSMRLSMRLKPAVSFWTSRAAQRGGLGAHAGGVEVDLVHRRARGAPSARRRWRISSEFSSTALNTASASSSRPSVLRGVAELVARDDDRHDGGDADQQRVDGEDLGEQRARAHHVLLSAIRPGTLMGVTLIRWQPIPRLYFLKR